MTDESGTTTYCYDRRGNVTRKTQSGYRQLVTSYTYTLSDKLDSITYPSGAVVAYTRDSVGRIAAIQRKVNATSAFVTVVSNATYYPFGPLHALTFGNGRTLTKTYDADYAIDSVASSDPNGLVLDFTTDVMGNIVEARDSLGAGTPTREYAYDALYRLTRVEDGTGALMEDYAYTRTGDRTLKQWQPGAPGLRLSGRHPPPGQHRRHHPVLRRERQYRQHRYRRPVQLRRSQPSLDDLHPPGASQRGNRRRHRGPVSRRRNRLSLQRPWRAHRNRLYAAAGHLQLRLRRIRPSFG
jgi:hypothetical protein